MGQREPERVGYIEAVAVADEHVLSVQKHIAEFFRVYVQIIMYQISGAIGLGILLQVRMIVQPSVYDCFVAANYPAASGEDFIHIFKGDGEDLLVEHSAAYGVVGSVIEDVFTHFLITAYDPSYPRPCHRINFGR